MPRSIRPTLRLALLGGFLLALVGCDRCGHLDITGIAAPAACSARPR